jgi:hypothetical protein
MSVVKFSRKGATEDTAEFAVGPDEDDIINPAELLAQARKVIGPPRAQKRVQLRIPLDDVDQALQAMIAVGWAAHTAMRALQSSKRQRNPELLDPLATVRGIFERTNEALNVLNTKPAAKKKP